MNILDLDVIFQEDIEIKLPENIVLVIKGNDITLEFYLKMQHFYKKIEETKSYIETLNLITSFAKEIIYRGYTNESIPSYLFKDIDYMSAIIKVFLEHLREIESNKLFKLPKILVNKKEDNGNKHSNTSNNDKTETIEIMENIAYLMQESNMSYFEVLKLPLSAFLSLNKQFKMFELLKISEYREKILKVKNKDTKQADMNTIEKIGSKKVEDHVLLNLPRKRKDEINKNRQEVE